MIHIAYFGAYGLVGKAFIDDLPKFIDEEVKVTKIKCDDFPEDLEKADYIVYGPGYGQPLKFTQDKVRTIEINTTSLIKAFSYLKEGGTFLYISTSEVYSGAESPYDEYSIGTTTPEHPRACYIEGKRCGEAICHSYASSGVNVKIARLALAYGPGTKRGDTRVINQLIEQGITGTITLRDGGEAIRTYLYITDAVDMLWKILLKGKSTVYNVGGFSTLTILELAHEIAYYMNATLLVPNITNGLADAPAGVTLSMDKFLKEFEQSFVPLSRGLALTIDYQKKLYGKK